MREQIEKDGFPSVVDLLLSLTTNFKFCLLGIYGLKLTNLLFF